MLIDAYKRLPLKIVRGEGAYVFDVEGRRYLDFYGAHAVAATGHSHPRLVAALQAQVARLLFYSNAVYIEHQEEAAAALIEALPAPLARCFFVNSGAEAVENALKVARKVTGRGKVLSCEGSFHGRTLGALQVTGLPKYRAGAGLQVEGHGFVPFGDAQALAAAFAAEPPAALLIEPIQSLAGVRETSGAFFREARRLCDEHGALLIYDELQTGVGRLGTFSFAPRHGAVPDLMTLGKGLASGIPMAALVATEAVAKALSPGDLGTTFGGGPLACLALATTLAILKDEKVLETVAETSAALRDGLSKHPGVAAVHGEGLLLGLRLARSTAAAAQASLLALGVLAGTSEDPQVLRLMPPLTVTPAEAGAFLASFSDAVPGSP